MPTPKQSEERSEFRPAPPSAGQSAAPPSSKGPAPGGSFKKRLDAIESLEGELVRFQPAVAIGLDPDEASAVREASRSRRIQGGHPAIDEERDSHSSSSVTISCVVRKTGARVARVANNLPDSPGRDRIEATGRLVERQKARGCSIARARVRRTRIPFENSPTRLSASASKLTRSSNASISRPVCPYSLENSARFS